MGCCGGNAEWKREEVLDHKFDFIDVREYRDTGVMAQLMYTLLYANMAKSVGVYIADIYTAITLLAIGHLTGSPYKEFQNGAENKFSVSVEYTRWIFTGCIIFSFLLLAYEAHKARAIVRSRDISYAYTNVMANNWYSLNSFDHFCFFRQINNSTKKKDEFAFFIFFTFKGWKRLLVADGPRQVINAFVLFSVAADHDFTSDVYQYYQGNILTGVMLLTMIFTVVVFAASAFLLVVAALMYIPLIVYIKGNLKEYCCHKIDKRISELVRRKQKSRMARQIKLARKEAEGDFSHLRNKKGELVGRAIPQPTLPNVEVDLYTDSGSTINNIQGKGGKMGGAGGTGSYAPSIAGTDTGGLGGYDAYGGKLAQDGYGGGAVPTDDQLYAPQQHQYSHSHQPSDLQSLQQQQQAGGYGAGYALHDDPTGAQGHGMQYGMSGADSGMQQQQQQHYDYQQQQFYDQHFAASNGYGADYTSGGGHSKELESVSGTAHNGDESNKHYVKANTPSPPMQAHHQQGYGQMQPDADQQQQYHETGGNYALDQDQQQQQPQQQQQQQQQQYQQDQAQPYQYHHQQQAEPHYYQGPK